MKAPCGPSEVSVEHVAWCGHLPVMRGGVATFTLLATQPFALTLQADPKRSAGVFPRQILEDNDLLVHMCSVDSCHACMSRM